MKVIALAGPSGAGKSWACERVAEILHDLRVEVLPLDAYYFGESGGLRPNFDDPESVDLALVAEHIAELRAGRSVQRPVYDFRTHTREEGTAEVRPADVLIVEGIFALHCPTVRVAADVLAYIEERESVCLRRRIVRDERERGRSYTDALERLDAINHGLDTFVAPSKAHATLVGNAPTVVAGVIRSVLMGGRSL